MKNVQRTGRHKMLHASDDEAYGEGKKKKNATEAEKMSRKQDQSHDGHHIDRSQGLEDLMSGKARSDFRHEDQMPIHDFGMGQNNERCV